MNNKTAQMNYGLGLQSLPVLHHNFTEKCAESDPYLESNEAFEAAAGISEEGQSVSVSQPAFHSISRDWEELFQKSETQPNFSSLLVYCIFRAF